MPCDKREKNFRIWLLFIEYENIHKCNHDQCAMRFWCCNASFRYFFGGPGQFNLKFHENFRCSPDTIIPYKIMFQQALSGYRTGRVNWRHLSVPVCSGTGFGIHKGTRVGLLWLKTLIFHRIRKETRSAYNLACFMKIKMTSKMAVFVFQSVATWKLNINIFQPVC